MLSLPFLFFFIFSLFLEIYDYVRLGKSNLRTEVIRGTALSLCNVEAFALLLTYCVPCHSHALSSGLSLAIAQLVSQARLAPLALSCSGTNDVAQQLTTVLTYSLTLCPLHKPANFAYRSICR